MIKWQRKRYSVSGGGKGEWRERKGGEEGAERGRGGGGKWTGESIIKQHISNYLM